jgi:DNA-binding response OmpR family regulator
MSREGGVPTVLLVEDDDDLRDAIADVLEEAGYRVMLAENGRVALDALHMAERLPHCVLLDLMMPVMDGQDLLRELRNTPRLSTLRVILLSANVASIARARELGADGAICKPVTPDAVLALVGGPVRA